MFFPFVRPRYFFNVELYKVWYVNFSPRFKRLLYIFTDTDSCADFTIHISYMVYMENVNISCIYFSILENMQDFISEQLSYSFINRLNNNRYFMH